MLVHPVNSVVIGSKLQRSWSKSISSVLHENVPLQDVKYKCGAVFECFLMPISKWLLDARCTCWVEGCFKLCNDF